MEEQEISGSALREATFPQALRGYEREAVHSFLDRVASWVESGGAGNAAESSSGAMKDELAKVGERTAGILTAAEDAATKLRSDAKEYAEKTRASAQDEARKASINASQKADEIIAAAEAKAEAIIDDAVARRRNLNQAISSLLERRDEIAVEAQRLADEMLQAVDVLRSEDAVVEKPEIGEQIPGIEPRSEELELDSDEYDELDSDEQELIDSDGQELEADEHELLEAEDEIEADTEPPHEADTRVQNIDTPTWRR
ncbi:MAG: DivIVA domain-containing protein [Actinomycetota bacterium]|nr:DivIVA domain-containing protein [Actinomycetota bacterium]